MSHIDEGALHAYLDGALDAYPAPEAARIRAHLDSCDECARRLEEQRVIREEAESILAPSAPVVQMPPLEELRALARRRTETSYARGMSRVNRWGWAASVVLALGSGWMLRGAIPGMISRPTLEEQVTPPGASAPAADESVATPDPSEADRKQGAPGGGASTDPGVGFESEVSAVGGTLDVADADALEEQVLERDAPAGAGEAVSPSPTSVPAPAPTLAQERAVMVDSVAGTREAEERLAPNRAEASVARRAPPPAEVVEEPSPAVEGRSRGAVQLRAAFDRGDDVAAAKSIVGFVGAGSLVVPDLQIIEVVVVEDAQVDGVLLVRQLMENGDTLEILHLPAGSDPAAFVPSPADARTRLVAERGEGWVILRADAPEDELDAYLRRLLGG